jgi:WD40 repeat protein
MIWNVPDSRYVQRLLFPERLVTCVVFSLDSTRLVSCGGKITLWDVDSGTRLLQLREHSGAIQSVAFSHNSLRLASASLDKTIKILALSDDGYEEERESHGRIVWSVAFSHDSTRLVSASSDTTIRVWDATSGECLDVLMDHKMAVRAVTFSHDSKQLVSASEDGTIKIWDVNSWTPLRTLEGYDGSLCSVALSHDSAQLASGSTSGRITIWDTHGWNRMQKLAGHSRGIGSLAFSHDLKQLASASWDLTVKIWDIYSGECTRTFNVGQTLYRIAFDASSSRLDTERGFIDVTSPSSTQTASISEHPRSQCKGAQISPDGEWILSQGKRILWMPSEYRPSSSALSGSSIAIGAGSGKVWICHLL